MSTRTVLALLVLTCVAAPAPDDDKFLGKQYVDYAKKMKQHGAAPIEERTVAPDDRAHLGGKGLQIWYYHEATQQACVVDKTTGKILLHIRPVNAGGFDKDKVISSDFAPALVIKRHKTLGDAAKQLRSALTSLDYRVKGLHPLARGGFVLVTLAERYDPGTGESFLGTDERYPKEVRAKKHLLKRVWDDIWGTILPNDREYYRQFVFVVAKKSGPLPKLTPRQARSCLEQSGAGALPAAVEQTPFKDVRCTVYVYRYVQRAKERPPPPGKKPRRKRREAWGHVEKAGIAEMLEKS